MLGAENVVLNIGIEFAPPATAYPGLSSQVVNDVRSIKQLLQRSIIDVRLDEAEALRVGEEGEVAAFDISGS